MGNDDARAKLLAKIGALVDAYQEGSDDDDADLWAPSPEEGAALAQCFMIAVLRRRGAESALALLEQIRHSTISTRPRLREENPDFHAWECFGEMLDEVAQLNGAGLVIQLRVSTEGFRQSFAELCKQGSLPRLEDPRTFGV